MLVAAAWMVALGHWRSVWVGIVALPLSIPVFPFLIFPAAFFAGLISITRGRTSKVMQFLSMACLVAVLAAWTAASFTLMSSWFLSTAKIPALLFSVAAAVTPWAMFAAKDRGNVMFTLLVFYMAVAAAALCFFDARLSFAYSFLFSAAVIGVFAGAQAWLESRFPA